MIDRWLAVMVRHVEVRRL